MKSSPTLILVLALGCAGAGIGLWIQYSELIELRTSALDADALANLRKGISRAQRDILDAKARLAGQQTASADAGDKADDPDRAARKKARQEAKREANRAKQEAAWLTMMKDPEYRRLSQLSHQQIFEFQTDRALATMNLPPDKLQKLHDLLLDQSLAIEDANNLAREQGITYQSDPKAYQQLFSTIFQDTRQKAEDEVGQGVLNQYFKAQMATNPNQVAVQLSNSLSYTQAPLTADQAAQLSKIIASNPAKIDKDAPIAVINPGNDTPYTGKGNVLTVTSVGDTTMISSTQAVSDAAINAATGILSPQQIAALKQIQQTQESQVTLGKIYADTQAAGGTAKVAKK